MKIGKSEQPQAIFADIDGTILKHRGKLSNMLRSKPKALPNVVDKIDDWISRGYKVFLTTGRPETSRARTEEQLRQCNICYHVLIMDVPTGCRHIINDERDPSDGPTAIGHSVKRDSGFGTVNIG